MSKKTIIITGVSSGLGKALFDALRTLDARLICISRTFLDYQKALSSDSVTLLPCDLSKLEEVSALTHKLGEMLLGASDIVFINNAATIAPVGSVGELDEVSMIAATHTNFVSPMLITNMLCKLKKDRLTVVHLSTGAAHTPIVGWPLYCSTKAACNMFFAVLQEQCKGNTRVAIHQFDPGVMDTSMQEQIRQSSNKDFPRIAEFKDYKKDHRLSDPRAVAERLIREYIRV